MTISMPNDEQQTPAVATDGYENCDKDMLIKLLRARDAEAANANEKLERLEEDNKKKDKALQAKDIEIKELKDENKKLGDDIENKETLISNIVIKNMGECKTVYEFFEKELNLGGGLVFYLARDIEEKLARMNQEHNEQLAMSWRQSRINNQSKSEKNKGEPPLPKAPSSDEQDDDLGFDEATPVKTLDELPDTYSPETGIMIQKSSLTPKGTRPRPHRRAQRKMGKRKTRKIRRSSAIRAKSWMTRSANSILQIKKSKDATAASLSVPLPMTA